MNDRDIAEEVEKFYLDECNRGRNATAMTLALARYRVLMRQERNLELKRVVHEWEK